MVHSNWAWFCWFRDTDQKKKGFLFEMKGRLRIGFSLLILLLNPKDTLIHTCNHPYVFSPLCKSFVSLNHNFISFSKHAARNKSNIPLIFSS